MVTEDPQALLLVYHTRPWLSGKRWLDKSNDPDLRRSPMTWGICRTNVRRSARVGAHLFFVAYHADATHLPLQERYVLSAYFHVGERIEQHQARSRFGRRPNVILDRLPRRPTLADSVHDYLAYHRTRLRWEDADGIRCGLDAGGTLIRAQAGDHVVELDGKPFIHAFWDHHADWRRRLNGPYLVADLTHSKILAQPPAYATCAAACAALPAVEQLRIPRVYRHPARRVRGEALAYLLDAADRAEPWAGGPAVDDTGEIGEGHRPC